MTAAHLDASVPATGYAVSGRPFVVGIGGTPRPSSRSQLAVVHALDAAARAGATTLFLGANELDLPPYAPEDQHRTDNAIRLVDAVRNADGVILGSPGYHGGPSGLVKNALDYLEDLRDDVRPYLDGRAVGCISCAAGWQATMTTLTALRSIVHALRGWPTPLGVAINTAAPASELEDATIAQLEIMGEQVVAFASAYAPLGV